MLETDSNVMHMVNSHPQMNTLCALEIEDIEAIQQERRRREDETFPRVRKVRPAWRMLYAVLPLTILLLTVAAQVPPASGWRSTAELLVALVSIAAALIWVRANRTALLLANETRPDNKGARP